MVEQYTPVTAKVNPARRARMSQPARVSGDPGYGVGVGAGTEVAGAGPTAGVVGTLTSM